MLPCISRHQTSRLTLVGTRVGTKVAKTVLMSAAAGKLTPEIVGEALMSSSTVRGHVQREAMRLIVVRVSMQAPRQLQWLVHLIGDYAGGLSATDALSALTKRSLFYQVTSFGMRGSAASAIATAALQLGVTTCTLFTSNAAFWRDRDSRMSLRQYRYELLTSLFTSAGTVAGGAAGAAVGSMVMPGIGTAFGSVLCSVGGGYVPGYMRDKKGPDDRRRQQAVALRRYGALRMCDTPEGAVLMSAEELVETPPIAPPSAAAAAVTATAAPPRMFSASEESASDSATQLEVEASVEEVVWLDFVRADTPAVIAVGTSASVASVADLLEDADEEESGDAAGSHTALMRSSIRLSPALALRSQHGGAAKSVAGSGTGLSSSAVSEVAVAAAGDVASLSSISSAASSLSSSSGSVAEGNAQRFEGRAMYLTAATEAEMQEKLDRCCGEDEMLFVFA